MEATMKATTEQRKSITDAITRARSAVAAVDDDATDAQVTAAENAITAIATAIKAADNVPKPEKDAHTTTHDSLQSQLTAAVASRKTAMDAAKSREEAAQREADIAVAATATKLYAGIAAQNGSDVDVAAGTALPAGERAAAYNDASGSGATAVAADTRIHVGIGAAPEPLMEDEDATVPDNYGWEGKKYTAEPTGGGTYEAMVYSNVEAATQGKKFGRNGTANNDYEYSLTSGSLASTFTYVPKRVDFSDSAFEGNKKPTAGKATFAIPEDLDQVTIPGSYHGVPGQYICTPGTRADGCSATVGSTTDNSREGFTLDSGDTWTFRPTNAETRIMDLEDASYASYGWWIHKSADDSTYTASAFVDDKGTVSNAANLDTLQGTATYVGGAAGKYALSSLGGTNDAGHFTAKATLNADFSKNTITGTIDNFMGADGLSRDWSVELKEATVAATGGISRADDDDTVWTIGGEAAVASGEWSGTLKDNNDDNVPKVATGTFYSEYSNSGKMVGAFGVDLE